MNANIMLRMTSLLIVILLLFWTDSPSDHFVRVVIVTFIGLNMG